MFIPYIMIFFQWRKLNKIQRGFGMTWAIISLISGISNGQAEQAKMNSLAAEPSSNSTQVVQAEAKQPVAALADTSTKEGTSKSAAVIDDTKYDAIVKFPAAKYPQTASHIMTAIAKGKPAVCTIDRAGTDASRKEALAGMATKDGYDRDEWPMAICVEGGEGADVAYVASSNNRGAGSWVGNKLSDYPDGTRILFTMAVEEKQAASTTTQEESTKVTEKKAEVVAEAPKKVETNKETVVEAEPAAEEYVSYKNCSAVRAAGKAPLLEGEPGYSTKLDRDRDGVACE